MPEHDVAEAQKMKYRMSCDICHAAKIKCGSQKPPCRRCLVKKLQCVYSASHRKGRPREKRNNTENGTDTTHGNSSSEPIQVPDLWTPPSIDSEAPATLGSFGLEDDFDFPSMLGSLDKPTLLDDREMNTAVQTNQVERREPPSPRMLESSEQELFCFIDTQSLLQQEESTDSSRGRSGFQSGRIAHTGFYSTLGNVPSMTMNQAFDDGLDFLQSGPLGASHEHYKLKDSISRNPAYPSPSDEFLSLCQDGSQRHPSRTNCECFPALLQSIQSLKLKQKSRELFSIGSVLMMERETSDCLLTLQKCKNCDQDTIVYLFAMVGVRIVLDLMQKTFHEEFMTRSRGANHSRRFREQLPDQARSPDQRDYSSLYIGTFKVPAGSRWRFLREMLQARFSKFLTRVEERKKLVDGLGEDCYTESALAIMENVARDLKTILGRMELWSSRNQRDERPLSGS